MKSNEIKWPEGLKKTASRRLVLDILCEAEKPLTANDIFSALSAKGENACLSTIYRILDVFTEKEMITKTTIMDSEKALFELNHGHTHYAVCLGCQKMVPIAHCPMEEHFPSFGDDFQVTGHKVEIYGYCKKCREHNK